MSTKNYNLSPLTARILAVIETADGGCTRKTIAVHLGRRNSRLLSNDLSVLKKLISRGLIEAQEYGQGKSFKPLYIYRKAK